MKRTFDVMAKRCDQCLFSKDKIVDNERRKQILADCERDQGYFICHKSSIAGGNACCRGFYDLQNTMVTQVAGRLGLVRLVDVTPEFEEVPHAILASD